MKNISADTLKMIRLANGLTQREVAKMVGYAHGHVALVEQKKVTITDKYINRFIEALDVDEETIQTADILRKLIVKRNQ